VSDTIDNPRVGVAVLIQRDNKLLLSRRTNIPQQDHWQCAGGYLRFGEDIYQCAQRCVQATGLQISQLSSGPVTNNIFTGQSLHTVTLYVLAGKCEGIEHAGWEWFDWQRLPQPLFLPLQLLVTQNADWLSGVINKGST
jgi:8-oxo-dGTP diphosphatase